MKQKWKSLLIALALLLKGESASAAAVMGLVAGGAANLGGYDPWTWVIGGFGAAVVFVKKPASSRADAIINGGISVLIGGILSPPVAHYLAKHFDQLFDTPYGVAFILSSIWPWLTPYLWERAVTVLKGGKPGGEKS